MHHPSKKSQCDGISLVDTCQCFRLTYYFHLQHFFYPDDEGTWLLWNVGQFLCNCMMSYPRRQNCWWTPSWEPQTIWSAIRHMEARASHNYETVSLQKVQNCTRTFLLWKKVKCSISRFSVHAEGKNRLKFALCNCYLRMVIIKIVARTKLMCHMNFRL